MLPAHEGARSDRKIGCVERPKRREVAVAELVQTLGSDQILQPVRTELANRGVALQEPARVVSERTICPPVGSGGDPRRPVDVDPDVALVRHERLAGVDPHAYPDRAAFERVSCFCRRGNGAGGSRKRDEERIALGVHLDTVMPRERLPQDSPVLVEQVGISRPVLLEESGRALDVREEKGDGAARQLARAHGSIIAPGSRSASSLRRPL